MRFYQFFATQWKFLLFGLVLTLFSTFGQTSLLSVFTPFLQNKFHLSAGQIGLIYSMATLLSAILISFAGKWIDSIDLVTFTIMVTSLLILSCCSMVTTTSLMMLFVSYFLLRFTCQGLMTHTSAISMARYFSDNRGVALSIAAVGYPIGDALLPMGAAACLQTLGFQKTWWLFTFIAAVFIFPLAISLLHGHRLRHQEYLGRLKRAGNETNGLTPKAIMRDWKFYFLAIGVLAPGFIISGIFFQSSVLLMSKQWPEHLYAASLITYAVGSILGSFLSGLLIDKFKASKIISFYLFPLMCGLIALYFVQDVWAMHLFMICAGLSTGSSAVIVAAVWAEFYGSRYLGTIRSWVAALKVFFTAISPVLFGCLIDHSIGFPIIILMCVFYTLFSIGSLVAASVSYTAERRIIAG